MIEDEILSIKDLSLSFPTYHGYTQVLHSVSFSVKKGETLAIVGESGSGKTVTMRRIIQLLPHVRTDSGQILLRKRNGQIVDITNLSHREATEIRGTDLSMIFQEPMTSLNPVFTIGDQLLEAILAHQQIPRSEAMKKVMELLELVRIPDRARRVNDYPFQLSGGMRQRVMIAMALACNPQILIADEPTTALDVTIQAQILALIKSLQERLHISVVFITHDMGVVAEIADRVVVMYQGRVVEENDVYSLFSFPSHPYTRALLKAVPKLGSMKGRTFPATLPVLEMSKELNRNPLDADPEEKTIDTADYSKPPLIQVRNLTTHFVAEKTFFGRTTHVVRAVQDVNFELYEGETLGVVGESGCGKSTIGYSLLKLVPAEGKVLFDGQNILELPETQLQAYRRNIQIVFQDPYASLNPRMRIGDAIEEPLIIHGIGTAEERRKRVDYLLECVGIPSSHRNRYPHEFSGGQRQRIAIARALATQPKVIIADEAVSSLDVSIQATVLNLMLELQKEFRLSYLFISHNMAVIERVSNRVLVMYLGQIVEAGSRMQVFENPQHPYTKKLLSAIPVPDPKRRSNFGMLSGEVPSTIRRVEDPIPKVSYFEVEPGHFIAKEEEEIPLGAK
ncbi:MAG: ABC transporter ATP-binding protein [Spirochaetes bacterium]|nr:ABC transporter ATP-binding protein [Spirochaetota bacterium]